MCNGFQVLGGLAFVEYEANCEVLWAATMQVLGSTLRHNQHTCHLSKDTKRLLCAKYELPKSSHSWSLAQQLKRHVVTIVKRDAEAFYIDEGT